jgi:class 3 adenylate cyclase
MRSIPHQSTMPLSVSDGQSVQAFAMIVDINGFTRMVVKGEDELIAQFTRDVLAGGITAVEHCGGEVVGFMGDAFYALLFDADKVFECCTGIAKDLDEQCEYISQVQSESPVFSFSPGGPGLKIGIEYGWLEVSTISSNYLKEQQLFIGPAVNYASRITSAGKGNRCLFGPEAAKQGLDDYSHRGPFKVRGKAGEKLYTYFELDLDDIWWTGGEGRTFWEG